VRILIVDDDPEIRLIAGFALRAAGHEVTEACDGAATAAACAAATPDLLVMDVMLGEEDGVAVARRLVECCDPAPRLVFLTAAVRPEQLERLRAGNAAGVVHKPFDPAALADTLTRCVEAAS
jgi:two-component system, OmpR family, response regulator